MRAAFAIPGDIATRTGGYIYERRLLEALRAEGREVRHLALPGSFPEPTADEMALSLEMLGAVPADQPLILDGFLSGTLETDGLARLAAPLVAVVHHPLGLETGLAPERARFLLEREAANLAHADDVVVPSPHTAAILAERFGVAGARITVAPPGLDRVAGPRRPSAPPLILSVGILHPRKGHDVLIEALGRLRDLDWRAVIVGAPLDPGHAGELGRRVIAAGLEHRVDLPGELDDAALQTLYAQATVFALATRYEGYGMVLGEALRHGLPIVSCRTGAVPDTVPPGAGLLVPPDDAAGFAEALRRVLCDGALLDDLTAAAARAGDALPDWPQTAAIVGGVLDRLAAAGAERRAARG